MYDYKLEILKEKKDAAGCRATAETWENLKRSDANSLFSAGCFRAVCAAVMREQKEEGADEQADKAMLWLKQAIAAGYKDAAELKKDTDLDPLRDRADFKELIEQLEKKLAEGSTKESNNLDQKK